MKTLAVLLSFALCPLAGADVFVSISGPSVASTDRFVEYDITVENDGPQPATNVVVQVTMEGGLAERGGGCAVSCSFAVIQPGDSFRKLAIALTPDYNTTAIVTARVTADSGDQVTTNNTFVQSTLVFSNAIDLAVYLRGSEFVRAGENATFRVLYENRTNASVNDVLLRVVLPFRAAAPLPNGCTKRSSNDELECYVGTFANLRIHELQFTTPIPISAKGRFTASASILGPGRDTNLKNNESTIAMTVVQPYVVTDTRDDGPGSLRQALLDVNRDCTTTVPCFVDFDVEPPAGGGAVVIEPVSPLPAITAHNITIDGTTQTARRGDHNEAGPEIEIRGAALNDPANGLDVRLSCSLDRDEYVEIRGFVINGFGANGIAVASSCSSVRGRVGRVAECYIGTDATGTHAVPNGARGISMDASGQLLIEHNVISGNGRSGVFLVQGEHSDIVGNRIGVQAASNDPLPNGASGVFVGSGGEGTDIYQNVIAFNRDFGVAVDGSNRFVAVGKNSIFSNGNLGLDFGLNGPTECVLDFYRRPEGRPELIAAIYDEARGVTRIEGRASTRCPPDPFQFIEFYASAEADPSGYGEGERFLGETRIRADGTFVLEIEVRLRGQFVSAIGQATKSVFSRAPATDSFDSSFIRTTEFSNTIRVE